MRYPRHQVSHGVTVRLREDNYDSKRCLVIEVEDHGAGFDPETAPKNSASRVIGCASKRGWGLTLIRELMDDVQIESTPGKTVVAMRKLVEGERDPDKLCKGMSAQGESLVLGLLEELGKLEMH